MNYYDEKYFNWQKKIGELGGIANLFKFRKHIKEDMSIIDFGTGGGYLLNNIVCKKKIGIELNDVARDECIKKGIDCRKTIDLCPDEFADLIISNHVLEHVDCPLEVLKQLKQKIKKGGRIVFVVPHQKSNETYKKDDVNFHLYTWNTQTLGNLFAAAGYQVISCKNIKHKWPPFFWRIYQVCGIRSFHFISRVNAMIRNNNQIKVVAQRL